MAECFGEDAVNSGPVVACIEQDAHRALSHLHYPEQQRWADAGVQEPRISSNLVSQSKGMNWTGVFLFADREFSFKTFSEFLELSDPERID